MDNGKLRRRDLVPLGPRYEGSRINRNDVLDEEEDDPFAKGFDIESSQEEDNDDFDQEQTEVGEGDVDGVEGDEDEDEDEDEDPGEGLDDEQDTEPSSGDEDGEIENKKEDGSNRDSRSELRRIMNEEQKAVTSSISQAARADAGKGRAVKHQRSTFNSLLNSRIRLQKALVSTNSLQYADTPQTGVRESDSVVGAAENAAFKLWSSLNSLREDLHSTRTGEKRKRRSFEFSTSSKDLWEQMQFYESTSNSYRNSVLNKWSTKTRTTTTTSNTSRLNPSSSRDETIVDVLTSHLADMPRLVKRARTPRSCAPLQASLMNHGSSADQAQAVYDDADLYSLLLKSLLEQTSADIDTSALTIPNQWQLARQAKAKKVVDTKASKGRKMRYTVHEKLQNFMPPEDRSSWGDRQREELFAGLLGMRGVLAEEETVNEDLIEHDDLGDAGVMLFGR